MTKYLIIGGGVAGTTAAEEIRRRDPEGEVTIIGEEFHSLYSRVLLPHYLKDKKPREGVFLKKDTWYHDKNIEFMSGVRVEKIDTKNQFVCTSEGRELPYDKLLVTTGGELRLISDDVKGVAYLRTLDDADYVLELIAQVKRLPEEERRAAVIGGGFIAFEFINAFKYHGINTSVFLRGGGFWSKMLSPATQQVLSTHAVNQGVELFLNESEIEIVGDTQMEGVRTSSGEVIPARMAGVGVGIETDRSVLADSGIEVEKGITANEFLETNIENVYTAGDVAEFFDVTVGRRLQYGNWLNAQMQGRAVAKTMTGERTRFELVSSYTTNLLGKEMAFVGDTSREHADNIVQLVAEDDHAVELFERSNRTVGAIMIGEVIKRQEITNAIKAGERYT